MCAESGEGCTGDTLSERQWINPELKEIIIYLDETPDYLLNYPSLHTETAYMVHLDDYKSNMVRAMQLPGWVLALYASHMNNPQKLFNSPLVHLYRPAGMTL